MTTTHNRAVRLWHNCEVVDIFKRLKTSEQGLTSAEAERRLKIHGRNELPQSPPPSAIVVFFRQFQSALIIVLLVAAALSAAAGEVVDAVVILAAVLANALVGFLQERKAEAALSELQRFIQLYVRVQRDGAEVTLPVEKLVPGDIVRLAAGDRVPADIRLVTAYEMQVNEALLTGESQPVEKKAGVLASGIVLAERSNMVYLGSLVASGEAKGVVVATGANTELGQLATSLTEIAETDTPLTIKLRRFGHAMGFLVLILSLIVMIFGLAMAYPFRDIFTLAVAIAVSAVPEGLAVVVTAILALGMRRTLKRNALVRRLVAAETLGSTTVICVDKTGTLTAGEMRVVSLVTPDGEAKGRLVELEDGSTALHLLKAGILASHAYIENSQNSLAEPVIVGMPTERALVIAAREAGVNVDALRAQFPIITEIPFNSERKYMLTLHEAKDQRLAYLKGAPERVLGFCSSIQKLGRPHRLTSLGRKKILALTEKLSSQGLRLILLASAKLNKNATLADLHKLVNKVGFTYLGMAVLQDPLRVEAAPTIALARQAGLKVVMITGDHKLTAQAIAHEVGLPAEGENVIEAHELQQIDDEALRELVPKVSVYARAVPTDKLRIIGAWQARGEVVAMTGDGVNDAPALKAADIGVALGSGSDVAKEASDMVLIDNNFNSIVAAVEEGRTIFQNIRKVVLYLISDSFSEVILMCGAFAIALWVREPLALPILATQILWINFISDTFPAIALSSDPPNAAVMCEAPIRRDAPILDNPRRLLVGVVSMVKGFGALAVYLLLVSVGRDITETRTIVFTVMALSSLASVFSLKHLHHHLFHKITWNNRRLMLAVTFGFLLQLLVIYMPWGQKLFHTVPLPPIDWLFILALPILLLALLEAFKFVVWRKRQVANVAGS